MMLMPSALRRTVFAITALAFVVLVPFALMAAPTTTTGTEGRVDSGSGSHLLLWMLLAVVAVVLLWAVISELREPRRFLRLASGVTALALALMVGLLSVALVAIVVRGDKSVSMGGSDLAIYPSSIAVSGDTSTSWGRSDDGIGAEERHWTRREYGAGAERESAQQIRVVAASPSPGAWGLSIAALVIRFGSIAGLLWWLRGILRRSADGAPFSAQNATALRAIAGFVLLGWLGSFAIEPLARRAVIESAGGAGHVVFHFGFTPLFVALFVLALSEVWRYGIELQREAEATI